MRREAGHAQNMAIKIAAVYLLVGGVWILLSDRMLAGMVDDVALLTSLQTYKGWFFVFMSGLLVYLMSHRYLSRLTQYARTIQARSDELVESQRAMETLLSNLPGHGMAYRYRLGKMWKLEYVSAGCRALTGYNAAELIEAVSYRNLIIPDDAAHVGRAFESVATSDEPFQCEYRIKRRDGSLGWVFEQGRGVRGRDGRLEAVEGYVFDVSEHKRMEEQIRADERLRHVGEAASTIIHDLKNQMQVIRGHVELFRMRSEGEREIRLCNIIDGQVTSMLSMSRELLDYARGEITLECTPVNVRELLQQLVETYEPTFARTGVVLSLSWRQDEEVSAEFEIDPGRINRALMNLVGNAKEALKGGGNIHLQAEVQRDAVNIRVQDDGPGIPEGIREALFEPFVTFGKAEGTGLGLAITKKIVEAHGGKIEVASAQGEGTTFTIRLPRSSKAIGEKSGNEERGLLVHS